MEYDIRDFKIKNILTQKEVDVRFIQGVNFDRCFLNIDGRVIHKLKKDDYKQLSELLDYLNISSKARIAINLFINDIIKYGNPMSYQSIINQLLIN